MRQGTTGMRLFEQDLRWPEDEDTLKPRAGVLLCLVLALLMACFTYHFHNKVDAFETRAVMVTGQIISVKEDHCTIMDFCGPSARGILDVTYGFHTAQGQSVIASLRHPSIGNSHRTGHRVGKTVTIHYLSDDPGSISTADFETSLRTWRLAKYASMAGIVLNVVFAFMYGFRLQFPFPNVWIDRL